jgi:hypothetical protein
MSTIDEKLEPQRAAGGRARRTHASLLSCRGYRVECPGVVSIQPMDERTTWRHAGGGRWDAAGSEYEKEMEA